MGVSQVVEPGLSLDPRILFDCIPGFSKHIRIHAGEWENKVITPWKSHEQLNELIPNRHRSLFVAFGLMDDEKSILVIGNLQMDQFAHPTAGHQGSQ
jgi:hypothetical protein